MSDKVDVIREALFRDDGGSIYAVLDGASVPNLLKELQAHEAEYICLFRGELKPDMAEVAPYLIGLPPKGSFTEWLLGQGWGKHWGVFVEAHSDIRAMRQHFRGLLTVYDPTAKPMLFRFYDPRVLRVFLPTCTAEELNSLFGPLSAYFMEDEDPAKMLRFRKRQDALDKKEINLEANVTR
ncbi:MAG TPA: DUF4123 domain-containing protein [Bryobacteraceae bacterium]|nr:DUF4123 domain-containing protein [Bryobacteraceae bacterium]